MTENAISNKKRMLIFVNIVISCIASSLLATALSTAMLSISNDLHISETTGQWMTSGYSLVMAIIMPLTAYLINRFPTKKLYCTAIFIFMVGLVVSGFSINFPMMMAGRVLQACGGGMLTAMAQVIILTIFPAEKKGSAMGWYGLAIGFAPVIAPTIAGFIVDNIGWRMIFFLSLIIMLISFVYALIVFDNVLEISKKKFDVISFILCALAFGGITIGLGNIGSYSFVSVSVLAPLIIGIVFAALFSTRQFHLDVPFLELRILKNRDYAISVIGSMLLYFNIYGATMLLPLYVQQALGLSATVAGLLTLPGSLASMIISPFAGKIYDKLGMKVLFVGGASLLLLSNLLMCFLNLNTGLWAAIVINVFRNIATGCLLMPLVTWGASTVTTEMTSHATALLTSLRTVAGSIGTAVFVAVMSIAAGNAAAMEANHAYMRGVNIAFLGLVISDIVLLIIGIWGTCTKPSALKTSTD